VPFTRMTARSRGRVRAVTVHGWYIYLAEDGGNGGCDARSGSPEKKILTVVASDPRRVFTFTQLSDILNEHRAEWHLTNSFSSEEFAKFLEARGQLRQVKLARRTIPI